MAQDIVDEQLAIMPYLSHLRLATVRGAAKSLSMSKSQVPTAAGPKTALALRYAESQTGGPPVPRPFLGGLKSGFHVMPAIGEEVLVNILPKMFPISSSGATWTPDQLDVLAPGESFQRHPDGRVMNYLQTNGNTALINDPLAGVTATLTRSTKDITYAMNGGTFAITGGPFSSGPSSLGVATATSLALGGATLGTNTLAVTGASALQALNATTGVFSSSLLGTTGTFSSILTAQSGFTVNAGPISVPNSSIAGAAINGNISGDAAGITGTLPGSQVSGNIAGDSGGLTGFPTIYVTGLSFGGTLGATLSDSYHGGSFSGILSGSVLSSITVSPAAFAVAYMGPSTVSGVSPGDFVLVTLGSAPVYNATCFAACVTANQLLLYFQNGTSAQSYPSGSTIYYLIFKR